jgi:hypothetical protein
MLSMHRANASLRLTISQSRESLEESRQAIADASELLRRRQM